LLAISAVLTVIKPCFGVRHGQWLGGITAVAIPRKSWGSGLCRGSIPYADPTEMWYEAGRYGSCGLS
jgi:hypothetical protein